MLLRALKRVAHLSVLLLSLVAFVAMLVDSAPAVVLEEEEHESEIEREIASPCALHTVVTIPESGRSVEVREHTHTIRETEVLRTRNVTFRIDRPPPARPAA